MTITLLGQFPVNIANTSNTKGTQIKRTILSLMVLLNISTFTYISLQEENC